MSLIKQYQDLSAQSGQGAVGRVYARFRGCVGVKCDVVAGDRHILIDLVGLPWWSRG